MAKKTDLQKLHPLDVRQLVIDGKIVAAKVEDNAFAIDRDIFDVMIPRMSLTPVEQAVYLQMYRHAYGRGLNCAQLSNSELQRLCNLSHSTIRTTMRKLMEKGLIVRVREGVQHDACIYRVMLPREILDYESATKVNYSALPTKPLLEYAKRLTVKEQEPEGPVINFNMLHLK